MRGGDIHNTHTDIATYRLNRPRGRFSENRNCRESIEFNKQERTKQLALIYSLFEEKGKEEGGEGEQRYLGRQADFPTQNLSENKTGQDTVPAEYHKCSSKQDIFN